MNDIALTTCGTLPPLPTPTAAASSTWRLATLLRGLALPLLLAATAPLHAQGLPAAAGSFVQLTLTGCGSTLLRGQGTIDDDCTFTNGSLGQGNSGANGSNLGGILRGNTQVGVAAVALQADSRSEWEDRFTYLGGAVPASVTFNFQLFGLFNLNVSGPSTAAVGEVDYRVFIRPFGSWGTGGSTASGTLGDRTVLQTPGPLLNDFRPVLQNLRLPVSLAGIAAGNSLDLSTSFLLRSQASAGAGGIGDSSANFSNSAGLVGLQFLDAAGADITPQVQYSWQWDTQFLAPVPEVGTLWLALGGLAGLAGLRARRQRVAQVATAGAGRGCTAAGVRG
jgi:hypothetical protein